MPFCLPVSKDFQPAIKCNSIENIYVLVETLFPILSLSASEIVKFVCMKALKVTQFPLGCPCQSKEFPRKISTYVVV
jgi:hypothetical protein